MSLREIKGLNLENFENWYKKKIDTNLNTNSNKNKRDYDKEPLILRDYSKEMSLHGILNFIFFFIALIFVSAIQGRVEFDEFDEAIKKFFLLFFIFVGFLTISYTTTYYNNDLQPYEIHTLIGNKEFISAMYIIISLKLFIYIPLIISIICFLFTLNTEIIQVIFVFSLILFLTILYDILFRMLVYKKSNKNLTNFWDYSQKFVINIGWERGGRTLRHKGATLYFFNQKDHDELKEYFFIIFHLDLDKDIKGIESIKIF